jgi:hypothetical protein
MRTLDRTIIVLVVLSFLTGAAPAHGQDRPARWQRSTEPTEVRTAVFNSMQAANLPTAETLSRGEFQFEISHRFVPTFSAGARALYGLDGPVHYRLGLGYAFSSRGYVALARSNVQDHIDLQVKYRLLEQSKHLPWMVALQVGTGWNTDVADRGTFDSRNFQYYGQLILNARLAGPLAVGVVPSYLYNPIIDDDDADHTISLGLNGQLYATGTLSFLAEWIVSTEHDPYSHPVGTVAIELETGGHFFKIMASNTTGINPSQYLVGSTSPLEPDELRFGFAITRLLHF